LLFIPALITHSAVSALPYVVLAAAALTAQNPPIDAARLDIMPPQMWGRARASAPSLRTAAQALAPVLFGAVSDDIFGGGTQGPEVDLRGHAGPARRLRGLLFGARRLYLRRRRDRRRRVAPAPAPAPARR